MESPAALMKCTVLRRQLTVPCPCSPGMSTTNQICLLSRNISLKLVVHDDLLLLEHATLVPGAHACMGLAKPNGLQVGVNQVSPGVNDQQVHGVEWA